MRGIYECLCFHTHVLSCLTFACVFSQNHNLLILDFTFNLLDIVCNEANVFDHRTCTCTKARAFYIEGFYQNNSVAVTQSLTIAINVKLNGSVCWLSIWVKL
jgi:hypothetical protein